MRLMGSFHTRQTHGESGATSVSGDSNSAGATLITVDCSTVRPATGAIVSLGCGSYVSAMDLPPPDPDLPQPAILADRSGTRSSATTR